MLVTAVFALACAAPAPAPDPQLLDTAERLCLDAQFATAVPLLREYLRSDRGNAVAHYYLGRCYLSKDLINLELARGEITAALELFHQHGQESPRGRFTDEYFELMCLTDIGKTYMSELALTIPHMIASPEQRVREAQERLTRCEALCERANRINPEAQLTRWLCMHTADLAASMKLEQP